MANKLAFLTSNRFWALVIASLTVVANGDFTVEAWLQGLSALALGFIGIRTVDRFSEKIGAK